MTRTEAPVRPLRRIGTPELPTAPSALRQPPSPIGAGASTRRRVRRPALRLPPSGMIAPAPSLAGSAECPDSSIGVGPYRMSRRARLALTLLVVAAITVVAVSRLGGEPQIRSVTVGAGDSLWSIAERVAPDADIGALVDEIGEVNGLTSDTVHPGQVLSVPLP